MHMKSLLMDAFHYQRMDALDFYYQWMHCTSIISGCTTNSGYPDALHTRKLLALLQAGVLIYGHCSLCSLV